MGRHAGQGRRQDAIVAPAQDRVVRAGHADVGLIGRAVLEDLFVGRGDVGVRAEHGRDPAVEVAAQELLVAGRLGVDVDDDDPRVAADPLEDAVGWRGTGNRPAS